MRVIDNANVEVQVEYDIPAIIGKQATLAQSAVFYTINGESLVRKGPVVPAGNPSGGNHIMVVFVIPAPLGAVTVVKAYALSTDIKGTTGPASPSGSLTIDRTLDTVNAPINFFIA